MRKGSIFSRSQKKRRENIVNRKIRLTRCQFGKSVWPLTRFVSSLAHYISISHSLWPSVSSFHLLFSSAASTHSAFETLSTHLLHFYSFCECIRCSSSSVFGRLNNGRCAYVCVSDFAADQVTSNLFVLLFPTQTNAVVESLVYLCLGPKWRFNLLRRPNAKWLCALIFIALPADDAERRYQTEMLCIRFFFVPSLSVSLSPYPFSQFITKRTKHLSKEIKMK